MAEVKVEMENLLGSREIGRGTVCLEKHSRSVILELRNYWMLDNEERRSIGRLDLYGSCVL